MLSDAIEENNKLQKVDRKKCVKDLGGEKKVLALRKPTENVKFNYEIDQGENKK